MDTDTLSGPDRAAIFLMSLGESAAAMVFRELSDQEIQRISKSMASINHIPVQVRNTILQHYLEDQQKLAGVFMKGAEFARRSIGAADPGDRAESLLSQHISDIESKPFRFITTMKPQLVADFLTSEHPQTIALILSTQETEHASDIVVCLPENLQAEIIRRMAGIEHVSEEVVSSLETFLEEEFSNAMVEEQRDIDGLGRAVQILSRMKHAHNDAILEQIDQSDKDLAKTIRSKLFTFESLAHLEDDILQMLLREISNDSLTLALKNASSSLKQKVFANISPRAVEMIKEDLESLGDLSVKKIDATQQSIMRRALKLKEENQKRSTIENSNALR